MEQRAQAPLACKKINNCMILLELFEPTLPGYQSPEDDHSKPKWKESRKTKLTLRQIRKLRQMLDVRNFESKEHLKNVHKQYSVPAADAGPTL